MSRTVCIAGAGTMGASLAQVYAQAGWNTILYNRSESGLDRAQKLIAINQSALVSGGFISAEESARVKADIAMTTDKAVFRSVDLVVENIAEILPAKQEFFREISRLVPETALLATNTSGLSISAIAEAVHLPGRFMGQHWLNPPHLLPVCEIVVGEKTDPAAVASMRELVAALGKNPVVCKDVSGFLINRLQYALLREALYLVESGTATAEDIDTVLKSGLALRWAAIGAFGVTDHGGVDVFARISDYLFAALDDSKQGSATLHALADAGKCGVKAGAGFYDYSGDKARQAILDRDALYIKLTRVLYGTNS